MRSLAIVVIVAGSVYAEPPTKTQVAWAWQSIECKDGVCWIKDRPKTDAAWAWANFPLNDCHCDRPCPCCTNESCPCKNGECHQKEQYGQLRDRAVKEGKSLIVGIGCEPPQVSGYLSVRYDAFPGVKGPKIVLGAYRNKELWQEDWKPVMPTSH